MGNAKECSDYHKIMLISHASKIMFNIKQGFSSMLLEHFQIYKMDLEKAEK